MGQVQPLHWRHYATGMLELEVGESIGWNQGESQVYRARWQGREVILKRTASCISMPVRGTATWSGHILGCFRSCCTQTQSA